MKNTLIRLCIVFAMAVITLPLFSQGINITGYKELQLGKKVKDVIRALDKAKIPYEKKLDSSDDITVRYPDCEALCSTVDGKIEAVFLYKEQPYKDTAEDRLASARQNAENTALALGEKYGIQPSIYENKHVMQKGNNVIVVWADFGENLPGFWMGLLHKKSCYVCIQYTDGILLLKRKEDMDKKAINSVNTKDL